MKRGRIGKLQFYGFILLLFPVFTGCNKTNMNKIKSPEIHIQIDRFEEDLFSISLYNLADSIGYLNKKYPDFFPLFTSKIIEIGNAADEDISSGLIASRSTDACYPNSGKEVSFSPR